MKTFIFKTSVRFFTLLTLSNSFSFFKSHNKTYSRETALSEFVIYISQNISKSEIIPPNIVAEFHNKIENIFSDATKSTDFQKIIEMENISFINFYKETYDIFKSMFSKYKIETQIFYQENKKIITAYVFCLANNIEFFANIIVDKYFYDLVEQKIDKFLRRITFYDVYNFFDKEDIRFEDELFLHRKKENFHLIADQILDCISIQKYNSVADFIGIYKLFTWLINIKPSRTFKILFQSSDVIFNINKSFDYDNSRSFLMKKIIAKEEIYKIPYFKDSYILFLKVLSNIEEQMKALDVLKLNNRSALRLELENIMSLNDSTVQKCKKYILETISEMKDIFAKDIILPLEDINIWIKKIKNNKDVFYVQNNEFFKSVQNILVNFNKDYKKMKIQTKDALSNFFTEIDKYLVPNCSIFSPIIRSITNFPLHEMRDKILLIILETYSYLIIEIDKFYTKNYKEVNFNSTKKESLCNSFSQLLTQIKFLSSNLVFNYLQLKKFLNTNDFVIFLRTDNILDKIRDLDIEISKNISNLKELLIELIFLIYKSNNCMDQTALILELKNIRHIFLLICNDKLVLKEIFDREDFTLCGEKLRNLEIIYKKCAENMINMFYIFKETIESSNICTVDGLVEIFASDCNINTLKEAEIFLKQNSKSSSNNIFYSLKDFMNTCLS